VWRVTNSQKYGRPFVLSLSKHEHCRSPFDCGAVRLLRANGL
jgi:hypothetical protein